MSLEGKRVAIMLDHEYQELEVWYPYYRLIEEGAGVVRVAPKANETYPSKLGYPCPSDAAAKDIDAASFDAVIVPGGTFKVEIPQPDGTGIVEIILSTVPGP